MNISTETREILRNYKAVINARRREMEQAVFLGGHYILQGSRNR
ncbi:TPA: hypothetical protein ACI68M_004730 [Escherichia coli]